MTTVTDFNPGQRIPCAAFGIHHKVVCAWCGRFLYGDRQAETSHGVCGECKEKQLKELAQRNGAEL